jgi:uncharacterized protein (TIGR02246 family)
MRILAVLVAAGVLAGAPALAQSKATIDKLNAQFAAAFNKGDTASVAAMYTGDAVVLPPGAEMVKGRPAIQSFWQGAAQQLGDLKLTTLEVKPLGSKAAREIGTFSLKTKGQPGQEVVGKYVVVWQKVGKDWKLATDIWNANK